MAERRRTWLDEAAALTEGAKQAKLAGDMVAFTALITLAAGCLQIARNLAEADCISRKLEKGSRKWPA